MDVREFKNKIASIYEIANELGREFNIPRCTPDGHLLGTIGQIAAKIAFGLQFGSDKKEHNCSWFDQNRFGKELSIKNKLKNMHQKSNLLKPNMRSALRLNSNQT